MKRSSILVLVTAAGLIFAATEYHSGSAAWEEAKGAYLADGESLDPAIRFAAPVADEQNFAAIPELVGITRDDPQGEAVRDQLQLFAFRRDGFRWPRVKGRSKEYHAPRVRYDLRAMHRYLLEAELLPLSIMPESYAEDIYNGMQKAHGKLITSLHAARDRPHAILLPPSSETAVPGALLFAESRPQLQTLQSIAKGLRIHALAAIASKHPEAAASSLESMLRLAEATTADCNFIIDHLVATAISNMVLETVWEGLEAKVWDSEQLLSLQKRLRASDPRKDLANSLRVELIGQIDLYDHLESNPKELAGLGLAGVYSVVPIIPWLPHNKAATLTNLHRGLLAPLKAGLSYNEVSKTAEAENEVLTSATPAWNPRKFLARMTSPTFVVMVRKTGQNHANLIQAVAACALERYQLENKTYPDDLDSLVPKFIPEVPIDPMDNRAMRYKRTDDGRYQLHSIGWDGKDDAGEKGDLTWNYKPAAKKD